MSLSKRTSFTGGGRRYIPENALKEAAFLEDTLPLRAFVTLTLPHRTSRMKLDLMFSRWIRAVQMAEKTTLGWIKSCEDTPALHAHATLLANRPIDCERAQLLWKHGIGSQSKVSAKVEAYRDGIGGLAYVMKGLDRPSEDIQFSPNLSAFGPATPSRYFGQKSAERRQGRRIAKQGKAQQDT